MEKIDYDFYINETVDWMNDKFPVREFIVILKDKFKFDRR